MYYRTDLFYTSNAFKKAIQLQLNSKILHKKLYMNYWIGIIECHQGLHYYCPPKKLGQGNVFTSVCQSPPGPHSPEPKKADGTHPTGILSSLIVAFILINSFWFTNPLHYHSAIEICMNWEFFKVTNWCTDWIIELESTRPSIQISNNTQNWHYH